MPPHIVQSTNVYKPTHYTQAVRAGNTIYVAGQVSYDKDGNLVGKGDFVAQAEQVYTNLKAILADAGCTLHDIVKTTTILTDIRYRPTLREIRARWFGSYMPPDTLIVVSALAEPEFLLEIEAIAVLPES